jgi:hypothetical protein
MTVDAKNAGSWLETFYQDLQTLVDTTFPKICPKCERTFASQEEFLRETIPVRDITLTDNSGLFALEGGDAPTTVGVFRNCECGTTLMADFMDRRDNSDKGQGRRDQFDNLHAMLTDHGVAPIDARNELLSVLHGQRSKIIDDLLGDIKLP